MKKCYFTFLALIIFFYSGSAQTVIPAANEIIFPQFAYVGTASTARIHYLCRLKLTGLASNATYRFTTGMTSDPAKTFQAPGYTVQIRNNATSHGNIDGMTWIKSVGSLQLKDDEVNFSTTPKHAAFTTDLSGNYEGWFACVPNATPVQQEINSNAYFYLQLNNGAGGSGAVSYMRTTSTVKLLDLNSTTTGATVLKGTSTVGNEKMVLLYGNTGFTGRPLSATWTENDGLPQSTSGDATYDWTNWYPSVDEIPGSWGTIIPNNLSTGVKGIQFYNQDGTIISTTSGNPNTSDNGIWNNTTTVNPSSGANPISINSVVESYSASGVSDETLQSVTDRGNSTYNSISVALNNNESLRVGHNTKLNTLWYGTGTFGKNGTPKALIGYLGSATQGAVVGSYNSSLNDWARLNVSGSELVFRIGQAEKMRLATNGNVGIGTTNPDEKLTVKGKIHAQEVRVDLAVPGPDYVFKKNYDLTPLSELQQYIITHQHLPEVPPAKEMEQNGVNLSDMSMLLLKKIEELTLHLIRQEKELEELKKLVSKQ